MRPPIATRKGGRVFLGPHPSTTGPVAGPCPGPSEATVSILEEEGAGEGAAGSLQPTPLSDTLSLANFT